MRLRWFWPASRMQWLIFCFVYFFPLAGCSCYVIFFINTGDGIIYRGLQGTTGITKANHLHFPVAGTTCNILPCLIDSKLEDQTISVWFSSSMPMQHKPCAYTLSTLGTDPYPPAAPSTPLCKYTDCFRAGGRDALWVFPPNIPTCPCGLYLAWVPSASPHRHFTALPPFSITLFTQCGLLWPWLQPLTVERVA